MNKQQLNSVFFKVINANSNHTSGGIYQNTQILTENKISSLFQAGKQFFLFLLGYSF